MKNRAKCKLCSEIIESFHRHDYVTCKCGEIGIDGGPGGLKCSARDWRNFLRVDDEGNEIIPQIVEENPTPDIVKDEVKKPTKKELIDELFMLLDSHQNLPPAALEQPVNQYDLYRYMLIVASILKTNEEI